MINLSTAASPRVSGKHMKTLIFIITSLLISTFLQTTAQQAKVYFKLADSILMEENSSKRLYTKLDTLKSKFIPSRSSVNNYFNRNIDFGFKHQRINLRLNLESFQIDLFKRNVRFMQSPYTITIIHMRWIKTN